MISVENLLSTEFQKEFPYRFCSHVTVHSHRMKEKEKSFFDVCRLSFDFYCLWPFLLLLPLSLGVNGPLKAQKVQFSLHFFKFNQKRFQLRIYCIPNFKRYLFRLRFRNNVTHSKRKWVLSCFRFILNSPSGTNKRSPVETSYLRLPILIQRGIVNMRSFFG